MIYRSVWKYLRCRIRCSVSTSTPLTQPLVFLLALRWSSRHWHSSLISLPSSTAGNLAAGSMGVKEIIIISSLGELHADIQRISLISNGFIVHEIAYNGNLSMAFALIVFPWAKVEADKIRVRGLLKKGRGCCSVCSSNVCVCCAIVLITL